MTVKEIYGTDFPVILAPMAGITDLPFRILCKEQGADVMVTEMISAKALSVSYTHLTLPTKLEV